MKPLPVVLRPLTKETLHSWLSRVAAVYRMSLDQLLEPSLSPLHSLMLEVDSSTLQFLANLTRTTPDFLSRHTVSSWTTEERLQCLTIWQTEPSWMFPHYEFRFQLTTNYCEACLLEDAATTGVEFLWLHWLLAPQTICPRHLTFLRETCRCCNRQVQHRHWRSRTKFVLTCSRWNFLMRSVSSARNWSAIRLAVKSNHDVVRETHHDYLAVRPLLTPLSFFVIE
jgi:hypothetical protein